MSGKAQDRPRILFMHLGRHGALGAFTCGLARAAVCNTDIEPHFLLAATNPVLPELSRIGVSVHAVETFETPGPLALLKGFAGARARLAGLARELRPTVVMNLMPHVFTPLLAGAIHRQGANYITILHDAVPHPGDPTARVTRWLLRDARHADRVVTLSEAVAGTLIGDGRVAPERIVRLFHPDIGGPPQVLPRTRLAGAPFRILFFGRIMAYKGLEVLVEAVEILRKDGSDIRIGVAGSGRIPADVGRRLAALGAEVENRWIGDSEVPALLARYDALACPHIEASQSGIAALAFAHALPVVAMPVGGIAEQVQESLTGTLATAANSQAYAGAIARLVNDAGLYDTISSHIAATKQSRSWDLFLSRLLSELKGLEQRS